MKWSFLTLFLLLTFASCGMEPEVRKATFTGSESNDFVVTDCQEDSGEVCGQPPMPVCGEGMLCAQVMPLPKTYSNDCEMKKEKAEFIQNGACPSPTL